MHLLVSEIQFFDQFVLFQGTTGQVCVNADYAAVGFEGKVQLHQVRNIFKTVIKHLINVFC